jgi:hypothetical protein
VFSALLELAETAASEDDAVNLRVAFRLPREAVATGLDAVALIQRVAADLRA